MNKLAFASVLLLAAPALAAPTSWEVDSSHSAATFSVKHMMVSTVRGEFGKITGSVVTEGADWKTAKVDMTVDATSINTREAKRDGHLKSPDFFDVAKYPSLTFKSTKVEPGTGGGFKLTGDLTIRGVTKQVTFDVSPPTKEWKSLGGKQVVGATATTKINRKDYGLNWNKPLEAAGGMLVGDDVSITIDLELSKKDAAAAPAKK